MTPGVPATSAIPDAVGWIGNLLAGPLATAVAVVAVALLGMAMLDGTISTRRMSRVLLGCFLLFGAHALAAGMIDSVRETSPINEAAVAPPPPAPVKSPQPFNPYTRASMGE